MQVSKQINDECGGGAINHAWTKQIHFLGWH